MIPTRPSVSSLRRARRLKVTTDDIGDMKRLANRRYRRAFGHIMRGIDADSFDDEPFDVDGMTDWDVV